MNKDYTAIAKETLEIEAKTLLDAGALLGDEMNAAVEMILACSKGPQRLSGTPPFRLSEV